VKLSGAQGKAGILTSFWEMPIGNPSVAGSSPRWLTAVVVDSLTVAFLLLPSDGQGGENTRGSGPIAIRPGQSGLASAVSAQARGVL
jgi:hypothetical protein